MNRIEYATAQSDADLLQIIELQKENLEQSISEEELQAQGFVTVVHELPLLKAMNHPHPHIIAKADGRVIGYALVMLRNFREDIPVLIPMFEEIDRIPYHGTLLGDTSYFVMGQVCVQKAFRGQGVFEGLFDKMRAEYQSHFDYVITQIAERNPRSTRAHEKVGFQVVHRYSMEGVEDWLLVLWDWR